MLNAILRQSATASTTGINVRLGTNNPTATVNMTELSGTGYTTGGSACTFSAASGEASLEHVDADVDERGVDVDDQRDRVVGPGGVAGAVAVRDLDGGAYLRREWQLVFRHGRRDQRDDRLSLLHYQHVV